MEFDNIEEINSKIGEINLRLDKWEKSSKKRNDYMIEDRVVKTKKFLKFLLKRKRNLERTAGRDNSGFSFEDFDKETVRIIRRHTSTTNQVKRKIQDIEERLSDLDELCEKNRNTYDAVKSRKSELYNSLRKLEQKCYKRMKIQFDTKHPEKYTWKEINTNFGIKKVKFWKKKSKGKK